MNQQPKFWVSNCQDLRLLGLDKTPGQKFKQTKLRVLTESLMRIRFWSRRGKIWSQPQQVSAVKMLRPPNIV